MTKIFTKNKWFYTENGIKDASWNLVFKSEVLAPVPSYEEFVQQRDFVKDHQKVLIKNMNLKRKLEIATKALERYDNKLNWDIRGISFMKYNKGFTLAHKALKEMEGVK